MLEVKVKLIASDHSGFSPYFLLVPHSHRGPSSGDCTRCDTALVASPPVHEGSDGAALLPGALSVFGLIGHLPSQWGLTPVIGKGCLSLVSLDALPTLTCIWTVVADPDWCPSFPPGT